MPAPLIFRLISDASSLLKTNDAAVASNTKVAQSYTEIGGLANKSADAQIAAAIEARKAMEANVLALQQASKGLTGRDAATAAVVIDNAQGKLNRTMGITETTTRRAGQAADVAERDFGKLTRGAVAGSGVFSALGRSLAFASTGFIAVAGGATLLHDAISDAENLAAAQRTVDQQLRTGGKSWAQYGGQISAADDRLRKIAGFSDTELLQSFGFIYRATGNVTNSLKLQAVAADIARARNISLASASIALAKAAGGSLTALKRLGITVPTNLKGWDALNYVAQKFQGQAQAGTTASERFSAELNHAGEVIGTALLPTFDRLVTHFGDWITKMDESGRLERDVTEGISILGTLFHGLEDVIGAVDKVTGSFLHTLELLAAFKFASLITGWITSLDALIVKWGLVATAAETAGTAEAAAGTAGAAGAARGLVGVEASAAGAAVGEGAIAAEGAAAAGPLVAALAAAAPIAIPALIAIAVGDYLGGRGRPGGVNYQFPAGTAGPGSSAVSGHVTFVGGNGNDRGSIGQNDLGQYTITYVDTGSKSRPGGGRPGTFVITDQQLIRLLPPIVSDAAQAGIDKALMRGFKTGQYVPSPFIPAGPLGASLRGTSGGGGNATGPFGNAQPIPVWTAYVVPLRLQIAQVQAGMTKTIQDDVTVAKEIIANIKHLIDVGNLVPGTKGYLSALQAWAAAQSTLNSAEQQAAQKRQAAAAKALQIASTYSTPIDLQIAQVQAQMTKTTADDIRVYKQIIAAARAVLATGKKNKQGQLAALQVILGAQQALQQLQQQQAAQFAEPLKLQIALAREQALGLSTTATLLAMKRAAMKAIRSGKYSGQALIDLWNEIASINQQLGATAATALGGFKQASLKVLTAGLGLTSAERRLLQARLSQLGPHGTVPGTGVGAEGYGINPKTGRPYGAGRTTHSRRIPQASGAGAAGVNFHEDTVVNVYIDGKKVSATVSTHQARHKRRNPSQRRGPNAGGG